MSRCMRCRGSGKVKRTVQDPNQSLQVFQENSKLIYEACRICDGSGRARTRGVATNGKVKFDK